MRSALFTVAAGIVAIVAWSQLMPLPAAQTTPVAPLLDTPQLPQPAYLERATDPVFGTTFVRVTEPGRELMPRMLCGKSFCRHRYSSVQAWNADQSLFVLTMGCDDLCFLDGRTFEPLFRRTVSHTHDCKWHPRDAEVMICVHAGGVASWVPRTNTWRALFNPTGYGSLEFGPYKGNPSRDGERIVVRAKRADGKLVAFALDVASGRKHADIDLSPLEGDNHYASISPSGRYIYVAQLTSSGREPAYVFTVDGALVQHWPEHHRPGHGDMTIDGDGADVYVGVSKSEPDEYHVIKRRLHDGAVTSLIPLGEAAHVSARNIDQPGWVVVSFQGSYDHTKAEAYPAPFYSEIVMLKIDGSGEIRRIGHARAVEAEYEAEIHASPSPDGSQIVWSSNWGVAGGPVSDFVTDLSTQGIGAQEPRG